MLIDWQSTFTGVATAAAIAAAVAGIAGGIATGRLQRVKFGSLSIESSLTPELIASLRTARSDGVAEEKPFEVVALSNYYNHALLRRM